VKPHIRPLREIPTLMSFILSLEVFSSMVVSIITPLVVLFGGSDRFSKRYRYKVHQKIIMNVCCLSSLII
jgi:hypothetical protein